MSTTTRLACPWWCRTCLSGGHNDPDVAIHATNAVVINDPDPDPEVPDTFMVAEIERYDHDSEEGTPRLRIELPDTISFEAFELLAAQVWQLKNKTLR